MQLWFIILFRVNSHFDVRRTPLRLHLSATAHVQGLQKMVAEKIKREEQHMA
jgi:hypothetical protein